MYVVLSVLSFKFVFACKDGKLSVIVILLVLFLVSLRFFWQLKLSILLFNFNYLHEKKITCHHHEVCVVKVILMGFGL